MITIKNLHKSYRQEKVIKGLDIKIPTGTVQMIVGANGVGKSTLINLLADIIPRDHGEIYINGTEISKKKYLYRAKVGYVLENHPLIERFKISEYLQFFGYMQRMKKTRLLKRIDDLCTFLEIDKKKMIENLSKGQKQKVALIAALVHKPEYLILDEPFNSIDFMSVKKIRTLFRGLADGGTTIIITSHQYDIIAELSDKIACLKNGIIEFNSGLAELERKAMNKGFKEEKYPVKKFLEVIMNESNDVDIPVWLDK